jgi:hypothetical protein
MLVLEPTKNFMLMCIYGTTLQINYQNGKIQLVKGKNILRVRLISKEIQNQFDISTTTLIIILNSYVIN